MAVFNGPAIKEEILDQLLSSVSKPEDLLGKDGLLNVDFARRFASREIEWVGMDSA